MNMQNNSDLAKIQLLEDIKYRVEAIKQQIFWGTVCVTSSLLLISVTILIKF